MLLLPLNVTLPLQSRLQLPLVPYRGKGQGVHWLRLFGSCSWPLPVADSGVAISSCHTEPHAVIIEVAAGTRLASATETVMQSAKTSSKQEQRIQGCSTILKHGTAMSETAHKIHRSGRLPSSLSAHASKALLTA